MDLAVYTVIYTAHSKSPFFGRWSLSGRRRGGAAPDSPWCPLCRGMTDLSLGSLLDSSSSDEDGMLENFEKESSRVAKAKEFMDKLQGPTGGVPDRSSTKDEIEDSGGGPPPKPKPKPKPRTKAKGMKRTSPEQGGRQTGPLDAFFTSKPASSSGQDWDASRPIWAKAREGYIGEVPERPAASTGAQQPARVGVPKLAAPAASAGGGGGGSPSDAENKHPNPTKWGGGNESSAGFQPKARSLKASEAAARQSIPEGGRDGGGGGSQGDAKKVKRRKPKNLVRDMKSMLRDSAMQQLLDEKKRKEKVRTPLANHTPLPGKRPAEASAEAGCTSSGCRAAGGQASGEPSAGGRRRGGVRPARLADGRAEHGGGCGAAGARREQRLEQL